MVSSLRKLRLLRQMEVSTWTPMHLCHSLSQQFSNMTGVEPKDGGATTKDQPASPSSMLNVPPGTPNALQVGLAARQQPAGRTPKQKQVRTGSAQTQAFHAMTHCFTALAASILAERKSQDISEQAAALKLMKDVTSALSWLSIGRLECMLVELCDVAGKGSYDKAGTCQENIEVLLEVLTLLGLDRRVFLRMFDSATAEELSVLPVFTRRLFAKTASSVAKTDAQRRELEDIVSRLTNLLLALLVEAPPDMINSMVLKLTEPLTAYAQEVVKGDFRRERACAVMMTMMRSVASQATKGKVVLDTSKLIKQAQKPNPLLAAGVSASSETLNMLLREDEGAVAARTLEAMVELMVPFAPAELKMPLIASVQVLAELHALSQNATPAAFVKSAPVIVEGLAHVLSLPEHSVRGIIALALGKYEDAVDLCQPFCDLDPAFLHEVARLLPSVRGLLRTSRELLDKMKSEGMANVLKQNSFARTRVKQIAANVAQQRGSPSDLFDIIDIDRSGTLSVEEFRTCTVRLGYSMNKHRLLEIFSKCKEGSNNTVSIAESELTAREFEHALEYLEQKTARSSLDLLGRSWGSLMRSLALMLSILLLIFVFIFLGVSAFVAGGVFGSIVNSAITISAGLGLSKNGPSEKSVQDAESRARIEKVVLDVKETIFSDQ
mmetsp:Transcript_59709/g.134202  ORF Transcript_59709/g.134202 Transcript_59709/m.134202 type:complete len:665 (+) Transcript_59709:1-1995(+)